MQKPLTEEEFERIYSKAPKVCVDLVIKSPGGIVLSLRNLKSWNNQWHMPGGTVHYKETIQEAAKRVARDELGISIKFIKSLGFIEYPSEEKERGFGWTISLPILCTTDESRFVHDEQASEVKTFNKLPSNTISEQYNFLATHWEEIFHPLV